MLDTETKRRIDTARDILVGKVPDPKSQVEQITIALIYKSWTTSTPRVPLLTKKDQTVLDPACGTAGFFNVRIEFGGETARPKDCEKDQRVAR